jgi:hypothetical protein
MLLFGGHILTYDSEHNRKRRNFFNDVWQLDLVSWWVFLLFTGWVKQGAGRPPQ